MKTATKNKKSRPRTPMYFALKGDGGYGQCSIHKKYKGINEPKVKCWACWVVYLKRLGWIKEGMGV